MRVGFVGIGNMGWPLRVEPPIGHVEPKAGGRAARGRIFRKGWSPRL